MCISDIKAQIYALKTVRKQIEKIIRTESVPILSPCCFIDIIVALASLSASVITTPTDDFSNELLKLIPFLLFSGISFSSSHHFPIFNVIYHKMLKKLTF